MSPSDSSSQDAHSEPISILVAHALLANKQESIQQKNASA